MPRLAKAVACVGGVGFLPWAPGVWATLLTIISVYFLRDLSAREVFALWALVLTAAAWSAHASRHERGAREPGFIVVDEVVGTLVAVSAIDRTSLFQLCAAGVLFQLFSSLKPWPICAIDKRVGGGLGVIADDLAAGLLSAIVMRGFV